MMFFGLVYKYMNELVEMFKQKLISKWYSKEKKVKYGVQEHDFGGANSNFDHKRGFSNTTCCWGKPRLGSFLRF